MYPAAPVRAAVVGSRETLGIPPEELKFKVSELETVESLDEVHFRVTMSLVLPVTLVGIVTARKYFAEDPATSGLVVLTMVLSTA